MRKKLIIIGGGAAGFFCAVNAAACRHLEVIVLEKSSKLLNKVRISGGGRCNVTHSCFSISQMIKNYPRGSRFLKKAFHEFFTSDTIDWFRKRGVEIKTESDGRMFPVTDDSQTIIDCLMAEARKLRVEIRLNYDVIDISHKKDNFRISLRGGEEMTADYLCIAAGGFHKADSYRFLKDIGHTVISPVPSLFTFNIPGGSLQSLMGISTTARVKINGTRHLQEGPVLITHWGLSGPAVLKLSAFAALDLHALNYNFSISVNWVPDDHESGVYERLMVLETEMAARKIGNKNPFGLPQRLWHYHLEKCGINPEGRWADFKAPQRSGLSRQLCSEQFEVKGKTTFKEEFVTAGGVELSEVSPATMESRVFENLFFAGEILNVDGITGGFNFQNAWTTGWIAARAIAQKASSSA